MLRPWGGPQVELFVFLRPGCTWRFCAKRWFQSIRRWAERRGDRARHTRWRDQCALPNMLAVVRWNTACFWKSPCFANLADVPSKEIGRHVGNTIGLVDKGLALERSYKTNIYVDVLSRKHFASLLTRHTHVGRCVPRLSKAAKCLVGQHMCCPTHVQNITPPNTRLVGKHIYVGVFPE